MTTQQLIATIQTTNPALNASLREPITRTFRATPRDLTLDAIGLACLVAAFLTIWSLTP